jgi:uncharacterized membrane protein YqaE (UPF0057 family)
MNILGMRYTYRNEASEDGEQGGGEVVDAQAEAIEPDQEVIDKATKMGWTPKTEFRGDPDKWRPADEFVERGENMLPFVGVALELGFFSPSHFHGFIDGFLIRLDRSNLIILSLAAACIAIFVGFLAVRVTHSFDVHTFLLT